MKDLIRPITMQHFLTKDRRNRITPATKSEKTKRQKQLEIKAETEKRRNLPKSNSTREVKEKIKQAHNKNHE